MELFGNILLGLSVVMTPANMLYCFIGVTLGQFLGVLPGVGALVALSLLFPLTLHLQPTGALVMLAGIYYGTAYGGSISSILLNVPGTPASSVICLDGYPLTRKGRAGVALFMSRVASFVGASIGIVIVMAFSTPIANAAIQFSAPEYFSLMVLGLAAGSTISVGSPLKGIAIVLLGILLGTVGTDINTGVQRYSFGFIQLYDGFSLVAIAMGLFGVTEVIMSIGGESSQVTSKNKISFHSMLPNRRDIADSILPILRGSGIGAFFGALPGTGGLIASFVTYAVERRVAKNPDEFGKGAIAGVVGPESANNAADQTAFIPTLTLGIPGSPAMALILGVLIINGIIPGPRLVSDHPDLFWGLVMSFWVGNVMLLILNLPLIRIWVGLIQIPYPLLFPAILAFLCLGIYSVNLSGFDICTVAVFGIIGVTLRLLEFSIAPMLLGYILGPLIEQFFRRALLISNGDFMPFITRPISGGVLMITVALIGWAVWRSFRVDPQRS